MLSLIEKTRQASVKSVHLEKRDTTARLSLLYYEVAQRDRDFISWQR
jgi:hypothetical protein